MAATDAMISRLRRMVNEPDPGGGYDDEALAALIELYPLPDADGNEPDSGDWAASYDLHAAASECWQEKASVVAVDFHFSADGGSFSREQVHQQYMQQARYHRSRRAVGTARLDQWPNEVDARLWVGNLPEGDG